MRIGRRIFHNTGDGSIPGSSDVHRFSNRIVVGKIFCNHPFRKNQLIWPTEYFFRVAFNQREAEEFIKSGIGKKEMGLFK